MDVLSNWNRYVRWLEKNAPELMKSLQKGATDEQFETAEKALGISLPDDLKALYRVNNGQDSEGGYLFDGYRLLSLEDMVDEWTVWKNLLDSGEFKETKSEPDDGVSSDWWHPKWIPITSMDSGDHHCLDLAPTQGGESGQIIEMWHDSPERPRVAASFAEWILKYAEGAESGDFVYSDEYGGMVNKDDVE